MIFLLFEEFTHTHLTPVSDATLKKTATPGQEEKAKAAI